MKPIWRTQGNKSARTLSKMNILNSNFDVSTLIRFHAISEVIPCASRTYQLVRLLAVLLTRPCAVW